MKTKLLLMFMFLTITLQAQTNLVPNGNFENWTSSSQPDKWFRSFSGLVFQSSSAQNGSSSTKMQITSGTFNYINSELFPVVAGKTYRITMYHKLVTGTFSAIDLSLYHQPGTFKTEIAKKTTAVTSSTEWRKLEFDYTPTVSESIEVDIWTTGTLNSEILIDNISVVDAATLGPLYTSIPDLNFEKKLIELGYDSGAPDGKVLTSNIKAVTSLTLDAKTIADLTGIEDFVALKTLICSGNSGSPNGGNGLLTKIDVSNNSVLTSLNISYNKIKSIDISKNLMLNYLGVSANGMTGLDVSNNLALTNLDCSTNQLTTLDISKNVPLSYLYCSSNQLTTLDVSKNVALTTLYFSFNQLTTLDLSKNVALTRLDCRRNQLTTLDLSKNVALSNFDCSYNKLISLNLKNGKNTLITTNNIDLTQNQNLSCILVDDTNYANTNWANKKDSFAFFSPYDCSLITQIPDTKFEDKLIALGIDTDGKNGVVLSSSIATINTLDVSNNGITDLKGIESFKALTTLNCSGNQLKKLDLSKNTAIATLNCSNSSTLTCIQVADIAAAEKWNTTKDSAASFSLDCTIYTLIPDAKFEDKLIALGIDKDGKNGKVATQSIASITSLDVSSSSITDLNGIQDFVSLKNLNCNSNGLTSLDITKNVALSFLNCSSNQLTTIDLSKNVELTRLDSYVNKLTTVDLSKNLALRELYCYYNQLTTLDLAKNVALLRLDCQNNKLTTLDLSKNVALHGLDVTSNQLTSLNLKNGKNTLLTNININLTGNPNLNCIVVDDVAYANTNWADKKDSFAFFSPYDCSVITQIPDAKFEDKLIALGIDIDGKNGVILNSSIATITILDVSNSGIIDLKGIEGFKALTTLNCSGNQLKKLDLSKNTTIATLNCSNNSSLTCIQVADIATATSWTTTKDAIASFSIDCTIYTLIPDAKFEDKLIALSIDRDGKNGKVATESIATVTSINLDSSSISNLTGIQDFVALTSLSLRNNQLTTLDVSKNVSLASLFCNSNRLTILDISKNVSLTTFSCFNNQLTTLDLSKNLALNYLVCSQNQLTTLDVSKNIALSHFECTNNLLTTLDVSKNIVLGYFLCSNNQLTNLDVSNNVKLYQVWCQENKIKTLDFSKNPLLTQVLCSNNNLVSLNIKNGKNTSIPITNSNNGGVRFFNNPELKCILVDDETYANANWSTKKDATASFNATDCTPYTLIPDGRFEDRLIVLGIDTDGKNGKVKTASIALLTDLSIINAGIKDLTGIQDFKALKTLICNANELTTIDLSKNIALTELYCNNNLITTLDVSTNINLSYLACFDNQIAALDVSKNVLLKTLSCRNNKIASLDLSKNVLLETLICKDNVLTTLNLKNGKNTLLSMLDTRNNSALSCILVDNVEYAVANFTQKDVTSDYSLNCTATVVYTTIPDVKFEEKLIALGIDNDGKNGKVKTTSIEYLKSINLQFSEIKDLTGIEDFKNLEVLDCAINSLTQLNVTKNLKLTELYCHFNTITSLDVSKNVLLTIVQANKNSLQKFDVSTNKVLKELNLRDNQLTTLNLKNGYNANASYYISRGNPNLTCIQVDSKTYADANWSSSKDTAASYSESCTNLSTSEIVFEKLSMYPNPTSGALFFDNVAIDKIRVYNALGKLMNVPFTSTGNSSTANLEQLPTGIYYIYLTSNDATTVKKVMVK